jgi:PBP1b-binding outer membrane lipoprotein LpoB
MRRLALLVLIALLAAGCGEGRHKQTEAERVKMENEFSQVAMSIANATITSGPADETTMEQFTNDYIALTRKYADDLGQAEVKKRLTDEVAQVQPWCLQCGVLLYRERTKY